MRVTTDLTDCVHPLLGVAKVLNALNPSLIVLLVMYPPGCEQNPTKDTILAAQFDVKGDRVFTITDSQQNRFRVVRTPIGSMTSTFEWSGITLTDTERVLIGQVSKSVGDA